MKAGAEVADERRLHAIADRLRDALPRVPSSFNRGRAALIKALAGSEQISHDEADALLTQLEELGAVKYTTEGRGIGVAGVWTYPRTTSSRPKTPPVRTRRAAR
jgi:hypothetical protein